MECRRNTQLEMVLAFSSVLVETLSSVHEQIERRTFGSDHLKHTIHQWEEFIQQIRVVLLLKSRIYSRDQPNPLLFTVDTFLTPKASSICSIKDHSLTDHHLSLSQLSLHKILAMDTLEFALRAGPAIEHESRCREVYEKRKLSTRNRSNDRELSKDDSLPARTESDEKGSSVSDTAASAAKTSSSSNGADVLLAWGAPAERRWRDILSVALAEDSIDHALQESTLDSSTSMKKIAGKGLAAVLSFSM
jgi:hypothetical protein